MVGDDLNKRNGLFAQLARHDRDLRQAAQADPRQLDARQQPSSGLDAAIDVPAATFDRMHGHPVFLGMRQQGAGDEACTLVQ